MTVVDLNADLGESFGRWSLGDDAGMLGLITSANIACGFHAGDPLTLQRTCSEAVANKVAIGAHVSYRDLAGFGRRFMDVPADELYSDVLYQLAAIDGVARTVGGKVTYVKPHGALYNAIVHHDDQADAVARAVADFSAGRQAAVSRAEPIGILGLPGAKVLDKAAELGLPTHREAFADRAYTAEGTLVSRRQPGSVLHNPAEIAERVVAMVIEKRVTAIDGSEVEMDADSVCVHGDSPDAVAMARAVREALDAAGVCLRPFASWT